jgi:mycoredoxin-dependent peroxiredoxin
VLEVGERAPDFALRDQHGRPVTSAQHHGTRDMLLVFVPAVFSSVCSSELSDLRDWWGQGREGTELLVISCDPMFSLRAYSDATGIDFPLLSDFWPHGAVSQAYGVFDDSVGTARRSSYLVDREGRITWAVHNARPDARPIADYEAALQRVH